MERIVLLGGSYVSKVLLSTARELGADVFGVDARAKEAIGLAGLHELSEKEAAERLGKKALVYSNAEDVLPFLRRNSSDKGLLHAVDFFKNKVETRRLSNELLDEVFFEAVDWANLRDYEPPKGKKVVIKPVCGFHKIGVRTVSNEREWRRAVLEIEKELAAFSGSFDSAVVDGSKFIVEEYIRGDEYACDAFFDVEGKPIVVGLYKHDFASEDDVRDLIYHTSRDVVRHALPKVERLLAGIAKKKLVKNLPVHFEFRLAGERMSLIEINPLRFGGFGLADLAYYAYGFNPYEAFLSGKGPDWEAAIDKMGENKFAFVVGQTPKNREDIGHMRVDFERFKRSFKEILHFELLDYKKYSFFATVITRNEDINEIRKYLFYDFDEYFRTI